MPKYDRELIARMLGALASFPERLTGFKVESVAEQYRLLREAENLEADARTVAREVPDGFVLIDKGAVKLVENVLRRNGKDEVADEMLSTIGNAMLSAASGEKGVG